MQALGLKEFLLPMLNLVPGKRATAAEMLRHPWLRGELPRAPSGSQQQQHRSSRRSRESSRDDRRGSQLRDSHGSRDQRSRSPKRSRLVFCSRPTGARNRAPPGPTRKFLGRFGDGGGVPGGCEDDGVRAS